MAVRLSKIAREFNVGLSTIVEFLHSKGITRGQNMDTQEDTYQDLIRQHSDYNKNQSQTAASMSGEF